MPILIHQMHISTSGTHAETVGNPKNCENCNRVEKKKQLPCREIETNLSKDRARHQGDNLSFSDKFIKFTFFLRELFIVVFLSKYRST
jgi:hypothetical protein